MSLHIGLMAVIENGSNITWIFARNMTILDSEAGSVDAFIEKPAGKKQNLFRQTQAKQAICLYYVGLSQKQEKQTGYGPSCQVRKMAESFNTTQCPSAS